MGFLFMKDLILALLLVWIPLLLLILVTGLWVWFHWRNREWLKVTKNIPSLYPSKLFLGTLYRTDRKLIFPLNREDITHIMFQQLKAAAEKPLSQFCLWFGPVPYIYLQKPNNVKIALTSSKALEKGTDAKRLRLTLGDGLLTVAGTKWKISRRYMNPIFHNENLNKLIDVFNSVGRQVVRDLACHSSGESFDVLEPIFKGTIASVSSLLFGFENQREMMDDDYKLKLGATFVSRSIDLCGKRMYCPWLWSDQAFSFICKKELKFMEETWARFKSNTIIENEHEEFLTVPKVYKNIQQEYNTFSDANMEEEMTTILVTGSETTSIGISTCIVLLGTYQDIQEKLYNEIIDFLGIEHHDITIEDINNLPYLDQVIKETLRLYPVIPVFQRYITEDLKLSECTIPKGTAIAFSVIGLHYDPEVYPDPYVFNPDRFTPEIVANKHPYSYLPFGGGPRNCIGKQYAMTSMKIMLIYILRAYKIFSIRNLEDLRYLYSVSYRSIDGYKVKLERRTK